MLNVRSDGANLDNGANFSLDSNHTVTHRSDLKALFPSEVNHSPEHDKVNSYSLDGDRDDGIASDCSLCLNSNQIKGHTRHRSLSPVIARNINGSGDDNNNSNNQSSLYSDKSILVSRSCIQDRSDLQSSSSLIYELFSIMVHSDRKSVV